MQQKVGVFLFLKKKKTLMKKGSNCQKTSIKFSCFFGQNSGYLTLQGMEGFEKLNIVNNKALAQTVLLCL